MGWKLYCNDSPDIPRRDRGENHEPAGSTQISPTHNPIGEQGNILHPENDTAGEETEVAQPQAQENQQDIAQAETERHETPQEEGTERRYPARPNRRPPRRYRES